MPNDLMTRFATRVAPVSHAVRRALDLWPLTPLGLLVLCAAGGSLKYFGFLELDVVLLVVGYVGLGLIAAATVSVGVGALVLLLRLRPTARENPLVLETGRLLPTGWQTSSLPWLPWIQVRWEWEPVVPKGASPRFFPVVAVDPERRFGVLKERVVVRDRAWVTGFRRRVIVQDAFGLSRVAIRKSDPLEVEVVPHSGALGRLPTLIAMAGGDELPFPMGLDDGDRMDLRRYAPGDPARFIHWKVFARSRELMVRVPERALSKARRTLAYLVAGSHDDATAAAARVSVETGALGNDWVFGADGCAEDATDAATARTLVVRSVEGRLFGAAALRSFVDRGERAGPASLVIFAPPETGPWLDRVTAVVRTRRGRARVVIGVDGLAPAPPRRWLSKLTLRGVLSKGPSLQGLAAIQRAVAIAGAQVVVVDRVTGRVVAGGETRGQSAPKAAA